MSRLRGGRKAVRLSWLLALMGAGSLAVAQPALVDSQLGGNRDEAGEQLLDPSNYTLNLDFGGRLHFQREYTREEGSDDPWALFEKHRDQLTLDLTDTTALSFAQAVQMARGPSGRATGFDRATSIGLQQGFGGGTTAGSIKLTREDRVAESDTLGAHRTVSERAELQTGLGAGLSLAGNAAMVDTTELGKPSTGNYDVSLAHASGVTLAEFHWARSQLGWTELQTSSAAFRTPTLSLAGVGTFSAAHQRQTAPDGSQQRLTDLNLSVPTVGPFSFSAAQQFSEPSSAPGTRATHLGTQLDLGGGKALTASLSDVAVSGQGTAVQRHYALVCPQPEGQGVGFQAGYTEFEGLNAPDAPTIDAAVGYDDGSGVAVDASYHVESGMQRHEMKAGAHLPLGQLTLDLGYRAGEWDPQKRVVDMRRVYEAGMSHPLGPSLTLSAACRWMDAIEEAREDTWMHFGLAGQTGLLGAFQIDYETASAWGLDLGYLQGTRTLSLTLKRDVSSTGSLSLSAHRVMPPEDSGNRIQDEVRADFQTEF